MRKLNEIRAAVRDRRPLIHCITNPISINQCANAVLAAGARPIMAEHPAEVKEITESADALVLNLGNILNAGFDQIFNLYSPSVYSTGDIIDTFVYRLGLEQAQFSVSTAVGLCKSVISIIMVSVANYLAGRFANYRVF